MLIISRKKNEGVVINQNTEITIIDIQGDRVRIGIEAPSEVKIVRKELLDTADVNREAAGIKVKPDADKLKAIKDILKNKK
jgi:carbon storage regulator